MFSNGNYFIEVGPFMGICKAALSTSIHNCQIIDLNVFRIVQLVELEWKTHKNGKKYIKSLSLNEAKNKTKKIELHISNSSIRVYLNTAYFVENWKLKTEKLKIIKKW